MCWKVWMRISGRSYSTAMFFQSRKGLRRRYKLGSTIDRYIDRQTDRQIYRWGYFPSYPYECLPWAWDTEAVAMLVFVRWTTAKKTLPGHQWGPRREISPFSNSFSCVSLSLEWGEFCSSVTAKSGSSSCFNFFLYVCTAHWLRGHCVEQSQGKGQRRMPQRQNLSPFSQT